MAREVRNKGGIASALLRLAMTNDEGMLLDFGAMLTNAPVEYTSRSFGRRPTGGLPQDDTRCHF